MQNSAQFLSALTERNLFTRWQFFFFFSFCISEIKKLYLGRILVKDSEDSKVIFFCVSLPIMYTVRAIPDKSTFLGSVGQF